LDLGFKTKGAVDDSSEYIEKLILVATNLERIRLRGSSSQRLNRCISQMSNLRSLTLRTGPCLTAETLVAISTFPHLFDLDIDAGHLEASPLAEPWALPGQDVGYFQSLKRLHVRAEAPVLELMLKIIPLGCLHTLRIDAATPLPVDSPVSWGSIFELIGANAFQALEDLTIEQHLEDIDLDLDAETSTGTDTPTPTQNTQSRAEINRITFDSIRLLAPLRHLRNLAIDMTRMPDLCDRELEALVTWWPDLVHLDFGSLHSSECTPLARSPRATLACLPAFASMPMLDTLIMPLSIASVPSLHAASTTPSVLSRATFSSPLPPSNPAAMAHYLRDLFPRLTEVEGTDHQEAEWGQVQLLLHSSV
jgi:hypothetical protein